MNEFERVRRKILINKDSAPFPYYVKITPTFKQFAADAYEFPNYNDFVSLINSDYGEVVASGDYITDSAYAQTVLNDNTGPIDLAFHYGAGNDGFVSEIKVSNNINNINTHIEDPLYTDFTTEIMDLSDINTTSQYDYVLNIYNMKFISEINIKQGSLRKITLPKNLGNAGTVEIALTCYLDTKDVEVIHPTDTEIACFFHDYKLVFATPTNKFIMKVPAAKVAEYTSWYSQLSQGGFVVGNYEIVGY